MLIVPPSCRKVIGCTEIDLEWKLVSNQRLTRRRQPSARNPAGTNISSKTHLLAVGALLLPAFARHARHLTDDRLGVKVDLDGTAHGDSKREKKP